MKIDGFRLKFPVKTGGARAEHADFRAFEAIIDLAMIFEAAIFWGLPITNIHTYIYMFYYSFISLK